MTGFLLGLSNGGLCLVYCAPVLVPYFLGQPRSFLSGAKVLSVFLAGRLAGYLLFGLLAALTHQLVPKNLLSEGPVMGLVSLIMGGMMICYGLKKPEHSVSCRDRVGKWGLHKEGIFPGVLGFLTGVNVCPPFLVGFAEAVRQGTFFGSLLFFMAFFAGTSLYMLPTPLLSSLHRKEALATVGRLSALLVGGFYVLQAARLAWGG